MEKKVNDCSISINFTEKEYEKLKKAQKYTTLSDTNLIRVLIKKNLNAAKTEGCILFRFALDKKLERGCYRTKPLRLNDNDYLQFDKIRECVPLSTSSIVKYWIMPELDKIIKNEGWEAESK